MRKNLRKHYIKLISPAIALFLIFAATKVIKISDFETLNTPSFFPILFFILASITAVAAPLFLRTMFAHRMRNEKQVPLDKFEKFQKALLNLSMLTPFFAFIAIVSEFEKFYSVGIILFSLYAVYYYFPSKKRIDFDKKIFRVNEES
jgi:hypothetical protein